MRTQFLLNRAWGFHIIIMVARAVTTATLQTDWIITLKKVKESQEEDGKPVDFAYNEAFFTNVVE